MVFPSCLVTWFIRCVASNRYQSFPQILGPRIVASRLCRVLHEIKWRHSNGPVMLLICDVSSRGFAYVHSLDNIELSPPSRLRHALTRGIQRSSPLPQHSDLWRSLQFWTTE